MTDRIAEAARHGVVRKPLGPKRGNCMNIAEAARATRRYVILDWTGFPKIYDGHKNIEDAVAGPFGIQDFALEACDRLNLLAVLKSVLAMDRPVSREFKRELEALIEEVEGR